MTYLIDTNVVSELRLEESNRADPHVCAWARSVAREETALSVISVFEIERGVLRIERRDPMQAERLRSWLGQVVALYQDRIHAVDVVTARRAAALHVPDPKPDRDAFIAATALVHGLTVVTRNVRDFEAMGVQILNPWEWRG